MGINEITGDKLQSKTGNVEAYGKGWDTIFSKSESKRRACQLQLPVDPPENKPKPSTNGCCGECC